MILRKTYCFGILAGSTILLKQTTGLILSIVFVGYKILEIRKKEDIKKYFKILGTRLIGVLIPIIVFAIYLTCNNIWGEFIDYTIAGIKTFSNTVPYMTLIKNEKYILAYIIPVLLISFVIIYITTLVKKELRDKKWTKNLCTLLVYDLAAFCIIYPISDENHFTIGTICIILTAIYLIYELIKYILNKKNMKKTIFEIKTFFGALSVLCILGYMGMSLHGLTNYLVNIKNQTYLAHFKYITTNEYLQERINAVDEYILDKEKEGKKVYILDTMAAVFIIPIDKYNKNYDMFNVGNFGAKGEKRNNRRYRSKRELLTICIKRKVYRELADTKRSDKLCKR